MLRAGGVSRGTGKRELKKHLSAHLGKGFCPARRSVDMLAEGHCKVYSGSFEFTYDGKDVQWQMKNIPGGLGDKMEDWVERQHQWGMRQRRRFCTVQDPLVCALAIEKATYRNTHPDVLVQVDATNTGNKQAAANVRFPRCCRRAAAAAAPSPSCRRPRAVALPPPPLPPPPSPPLFVGWLLRCCPPSDFVIACRHTTINALVAGRFCR
jgi:hypothetical protein